MVCKSPKIVWNLSYISGNKFEYDIFGTRYLVKFFKWRKIKHFKHFTSFCWKVQTSSGLHLKHTSYHSFCYYTGLLLKVRRIAAAVSTQRSIMYCSTDIPPSFFTSMEKRFFDSHCCMQRQTNANWTRWCYKFLKLATIMQF